MIPRPSLTGPFGLSLAAVLLAVTFLAVSLPSLFGSVFAAGTGSVDPRQVVDELQAKHTESMTTYRERFNGRSVFFKPPPIYRPPPPPPKVDPIPTPTPEPVAPVIPTTYGGPSLTAIFGSEAWFKPPSATEKSGFTLHLGEEKHGVKLLEVHGPWGVKVAHKGGEYTVTLSEMFNKELGEKFFGKLPRLGAPIPGLTFIQVPVPASTSPADGVVPPPAGDAAKPIATTGVPTSGPLQVDPLDGSERDGKPAKREATGDEEGDESSTEAAPVEDEVDEPGPDAEPAEEAAPTPRPQPAPSRAAVQTYAGTSGVFSGK